MLVLIYVLKPVRPLTSVIAKDLSVLTQKVDYVTQVMSNISDSTC